MDLNLNTTPEEILNHYPKVLLDERMITQRKLRNILETTTFSVGNKEQDLIISDLLCELEDIENELDTLIEMAMYPNHHVPILNLLTDGGLY